jgi:hypothetical protein
MGGIINPPRNPYELGTHYDAIKAANRYDLWRRDMGFDSMVEMLEALETAAKLVGENPRDYIEDKFLDWNKNK